MHTLFSLEDGVCCYLSNVHQAFPSPPALTPSLLTLLGCKFMTIFWATLWFLHKLLFLQWEGNFWIFRLFFSWRKMTVPEGKDGWHFHRRIWCWFFPQVKKNYYYYYSPPPPKHFPCGFLYMCVSKPLNVSCFVTSSVCVFREHLNKRLDARYWWHRGWNFQLYHKELAASICIRSE